MPGPRKYTQKAVAQLLGVHRNTIRNRIGAGELKPAPGGKVWLSDAAHERMRAQPAARALQQIATNAQQDTGTWGHAVRFVFLLTVYADIPFEGKTRPEYRTEVTSIDKLSGRQRGSYIVHEMTEGVDTLARFYGSETDQNTLRFWFQRLKQQGVEAVADQDDPGGDRFAKLVCDFMRQTFEARKFGLELLAAISRHLKSKGVLPPSPCATHKKRTFYRAVRPFMEPAERMSYVTFWRRTAETSPLMRALRFALPAATVPPGIGATALR